MFKQCQLRTTLQLNATLNQLIIGGHRIFEWLPLKLELFLCLYIPMLLNNKNKVLRYMLFTLYYQENPSHEKSYIKRAININNLY